MVKVKLKKAINSGNISILNRIVCYVVLYDLRKRKQERRVGMPPDSFNIK